MFFLGRKEGPAPAHTVFGVMDHTVNFMQRLHVLGGFGYILFGGALGVILIAMAELRNSFDKLIDTFIPVAIGTGILATLLVLTDKIIAFQFTNMKLKLMVKIIERMVEATIPPPGQTMDSAAMRQHIHNILTAISWESDEEKHAKSLQMPN